MVGTQQECGHGMIAHKTEVEQDEPFEQPIQFLACKLQMRFHSHSMNLPVRALLMKIGFCLGLVCGSLIEWHDLMEEHIQASCVPPLLDGYIPTLLEKCIPALLDRCVPALLD